MVLNLDEPITQSDFAALVGVSKQAVSQFVFEGKLMAGQTLGEWLIEYCGHLRAIASGRLVNDEKKLESLANAEMAMAKAESIKMDLAKKKELLLEVAQVEAAMAGWIALAREEYLMSIEKIIDMLESCHGIVTDREKINEITAAAARVIGDYGS